jgi:hypothetical protein
MTYDTLNFGTFLELGPAATYLCLAIAVASVVCLLGVGLFRGRYLQWAEARFERKSDAASRSRNRGAAHRHGMKRFKAGPR